jgi:hypothetical protein
MTRKELKSLVKECLLEVLQEGLQAQAKPATSRRKAISGKSVSSRTKSRRRHHTDSMEVHAPVNVPSSIKGDPIMESIFADTAATTLQEQAVARAHPPIPTADHAARIALENEPADLFEGAANWSSLAFDI